MRCRWASETQRGGGGGKKTVASGDEGQRKERGRTSKIDVVAAAEEQKQAPSQGQKVGGSLSRQYKPCLVSFTSCCDSESTHLVKKKKLICMSVAQFLTPEG